MKDNKINVYVKRAIRAIQNGDHVSALEDLNQIQKILAGEDIEESQKVNHHNTAREEIHPIADNKWCGCGGNYTVVHEVKHGEVVAYAECNQCNKRSSIHYPPHDNDTTNYMMERE